MWGVAMTSGWTDGFAISAVAEGDGFTVTARSGGFSWATWDTDRDRAIGEARAALKQYLERLRSQAQPSACVADCFCNGAS